MLIFSPRRAADVRRSNWQLALAMGSGVAICYFDRTNISHAAKSIEADLGMSHVTMGYILGAFSLGYVLAMPLGGYLADRRGPWLTATVGAVVWSCATALTGIVS